ncbi:orotidine-5'-phosphate decarboxylase [Subtercola frigoramans]|nr:orotidine-5'-phosphate decarboxylase [Subtercola frigoramans]
MVGTRVTPFGERLAEAFRERGQLCVGIDPHDYLLREWNLPLSAAGVREFGLRVVNAAAGAVGIVKPQVAFFELFGSAGYSALEDVFSAARAAGLIVIADAKRGDIGTSAEAYGRAWLQAGSPLEADAVTMTAYAGVGSLQPVFDLAETAGKGVFVLSATSNPESFQLQTARASGTDGDSSVAGLVANEVSAHNASARAQVLAHGSADTSAEPTPDTAALGNIGLVLGATKNLSDYGIDTARLALVPATPVLAPGFGFQGALFSSVRSVFGHLTPGTVVAVSRSVLAAGPKQLEQSIRQQSDELAEALVASA